MRVFSAFALASLLLSMLTGCELGQYFEEKAYELNDYDPPSDYYVPWPAGHIPTEALLPEDFYPLRDSC